MMQTIISFLASILTGAQVVLQLRGAKGLCFNNGCEIVESMTNVSPLVFNVAGFIFFQTLFWLFFLGRNGFEYWRKLARLLLLAGLAAEAVLVFFQHSIATVFCSYCLVIFTVIVLLNICCGLRQLVRGMVIFLAVLVACFSLQFSPPSPGRGTLDSGSLAMVNGKRNGVGLYLFFSASCSHCEKVIEAIGADNSCTVRFNPIERIEKFAIEDIVRFADYDPQVNRTLLQSLSINEVPVLLAKTEDETQILKGEKRIMEYLQKFCRSGVDYSGTSNNLDSGYTFLPEVQKSGEDACPVNTDCNPKVAPISSGQ